MDEEIVARLARAAEQSKHWYDVASILRRDAGEPDEDVIWPFVYAFEYDLTAPTEEARRQRWGAFAPLAEFEDGVYPVPLDTAPEEWVSEWERAAPVTDHPIVAARLHDLLWERRRSDRADLHARAACDAYSTIAGGGWDSLPRAESVIRALELARAVADSERQDAVVALLIAASEASLDSPTQEPGVALRLIQALQSLPGDQQPAEIGPLLERALARYDADPWLSQTITEMQAGSLTDDEERRRLFGKQVDRWRTAATQAEGLVRLHHLQQALELARDRGLANDAEDLRREIQSIGPDQLDLKKVSASVQIPAERVEQFVNSFVSPDRWQDSLTVFGSYGPPSGDHENNLARVKELMTEHPLQSLLSKTVLGPENVVIRHLSSEEEHREAELIDHETRGIAIWAVWAAETLDRFRTKYGVPSSEDLAEFFTTPLILPEMAERVGRAFLLYWDGQPDEGTHILVPRLEAIIRELCRQLGLAVIREPRPPLPGGVRLLGDLLRSLQGRFDESWRRYLVNLLVEPLGLNLRNRVSHALLPLAEKRDLALLLHAASALRLVRVEGAEAGSDQDGEQEQLGGSR